MLVDEVKCLEIFLGGISSILKKHWCIVTEDEKSKKVHIYNVYLNLH